MQTHGTPVYAGEAAGYIFNFLHDYTFYHSGDTALMSDMKMRQLNNLKWNGSQNNRFIFQTKKPQSLIIQNEKLGFLHVFVLNV